MGGTKQTKNRCQEIIEELTQLSERELRSYCLRESDLPVIEAVLEYKRMKALATEPSCVRVGVGVVIMRGGKVLLGHRKSEHGQGTWVFPGGKMEMFETEEVAAKREVKEETGLDIFNVRKLTHTNDMFEETGKHYITLYVIAEADGEPKVMEPDKCEEWIWADMDDLPQPLFLPLQNFLSEHRKLLT